ncbi:OLC1v1012420C1 [Oldenlandia corymbosa var. corymbosa]|uniref:OLC1v1012420C1 n=1 Tax=Oldenlandia corymbosa var. corymbosa TaxID=529605 RepID=A0AAV1DZ44_OLDCO|nr:OLC1v1012420C1 [Oldenlandia corymbosa var. corymbosa]
MVLKLELNVNSAEDLPDVRSWSFLEMKVFGEVSIDGEPQVTKTPVDYVGGINPRWNMKTPFILSEESVKGDHMLVIRLLCERSFRRPKYVGEVKLPLKQLFEKRQAHPVCEEFRLTRVEEDDVVHNFGVLKMSYCFYESVKTSKAEVIWRVLLPVAGIALGTVAEVIVPDLLKLEMMIEACWVFITNQMIVFAYEELLMNILMVESNAKGLEVVLAFASGCVAVFGTKILAGGGACSLFGRGEEFRSVRTEWRIRSVEVGIWSRW